MSTQIFVIAPVDATHEGPEAPAPSGNSQQIHLQQGSLDGACGPYSLFMALMVCGVVDREDITSLEPVDKRTCLGKLFKNLEASSAFFRDGTDLKGLKELIQNAYGNKLQVEVCQKRGKDNINFIKSHLHENHPVIAGLDFKGGGHWVLVVGLEYARDDSEQTRKLCRFLILDPSDPSPTQCAWNGVIDTRRSANSKHPYEWWTADDTKIQFDGALAVFVK